MGLEPPTSGSGVRGINHQATALPLKHLENQASEHLSLIEEQALLLEALEEAGIDSDDDLEDTGDCANCHRQPEKGLKTNKEVHSVWRNALLQQEMSKGGLVISSLRM